MNKKNCGDCGILFRIRCLQKNKGKLICKGCKRKKEKKKGFVSMNDIKKEEQKKRKGMSSMGLRIEKYLTKKEVKEIEPKIPGSKVRKKYNVNLRRGLSLDEQRFLLRKHMGLGLSFENAKQKIKEDKEFLSNFVKKMREKKKSDEEINRKFKEEFAKLCEK